MCIGLRKRKKRKKNKADIPGFALQKLYRSMKTKTTKQILQEQMAEATTYEGWYHAGLQLDAELGLDLWYVPLPIRWVLC